MNDSSVSTAPGPRARSRRSVALPALRPWVSWLHWLSGITLGTLLAVVGLTGALQSFRAELTSLLNPGVVRVAPLGGAERLSPGALGQAIIAAQGARRVATITMYSDPQAAPRVVFTARPGESGGETMFADPVTGALRPLRGEAFFEWVEALHRWLLLPREPGRIATGVLSSALLLMLASGVYLRWPRGNGGWRAWLLWRRGLTGRPWLWALHAVAATWVLPLLFISTATGIYWSFDAVRDRVDAFAGQPREPRAARAMGPVDAARSQQWPAELDKAWALFTQRAGSGWQQAVLRPPERSGQAVQVTWLAADAPHDRARNRMAVDTAAGTINRDERHAEQAAGTRALALVHPLHTGSWGGAASRAAMALASLCLPLLAVTGWMMYLGRRRTGRAAEAEARALAAQPAAAGAPPILVAHASQSGTAQQLAARTAAALAAHGQAVHLKPLAELDFARLPPGGRLLIVAASFGDGEAPDAVRGFARRFLSADADLPALDGWRYALLALGDRSYAHFCGFGRALDARLRERGARALWPLIEVHARDAQALARWSDRVHRLAGAAAPGTAFAAEAAPAWTPWQLRERKLLNPGSAGSGLYEVSLQGPPGSRWQAGELLEVRMPSDPDLPRRYSIASLPEDGCVQLLVRQARHAHGLGLASGWLTATAAPGASVQARVRANPGFAPVDAARPGVFIGNGSGLAGLRGHLRHRVQRGARRNWLIFGERQRAHDSLCAEEIARWQADGFLERLDLVFSRDGQQRDYVQHRLRTHADTVRAWADEGAVFFVCGSLQGMAGGVDAALRQVLGDDAVDALAASGRYRRDVY